jgi:DNA-binding transcriptional MerR regulator
MWDDHGQYYPVTEAFSRQQVQERTGIADDVLGFWIKQNLLVPLPSKPRMHRRFGYEQLHIAVVLNAMRSLGANVGVLRKFGDAFQTGFTLWKASALKAEALAGAIRLSERLKEFASGKKVRIYTSEADFEAERDAEIEAEIVQSWLWREAVDGARSSNVAFAKALSAYEASSLSWALDLNATSHLTLDNRDSGDAWIAWIDPEGGPRIAYGNAVALHNEDGPLAAFYIPVSRLIKQLWSDRVKAAQDHRAKRLHNSRLALLIECEASEPARASALRRSWGLQDDWKKTYQPVPEDDDMTG